MNRSSHTNSAPTGSDAFAQVQARYADVPGSEGAELRRQHYAPFFLRMGRDVHIDEGCRFFHPERIVLDDDARINIGALIYGSGGVWIGRHARIGPRCFIHSANHDVAGVGASSGLAFFERSYRDDAVMVGDLCLISANVSLLPGVRLQPGAFVACGAVVPRGTYPGHVHLRGVPARAVDEPAPAVPADPDALVIVPDAGYWRRAALSVLVGLGLPQVQVITERDVVPHSARVALVLGPPGWRPSGLRDDLALWTLEAGTAPVHAPDLPARRPFPVIDDGPTPGDPALHRAAFWIVGRLCKGSAPLAPRDFREWATALRLLKMIPGCSEALLEHLLAHLWRRRPAQCRGLPQAKDAPDLEAWLDQAAEGASEQPPHNDPCPQGFFRRLFRREEPPPAPPAPSPLRQAMSDPEALVRRTLRGQCTPAELAPLVEGMLNSNPTGLRLTAFGAAALLVRDDASHARIAGRLAEPEWRVEEVALPRAARGRAAICYSPLALAYHALRVARSDPGFTLTPEFGAPRAQEHALAWLGFEGAGPGGEAELFHTERRCVARSLLDNWLAVHRAPCPEGASFLLTNPTYAVSTLGMERRWLAVFRAMLHGARQPLVRVHPWPAGCRAAVSIRFDVDRPVNAGTVAAIVKMQAQLANAPCASWYYFPAHADRTRQAPQLRRHWQEEGLHLEHAADAEAGLGVTHHSAPRSEYWRGDATNAHVRQRGADYGEFLAARLPAARPTWPSPEESSEHGSPGNGCSADQGPLWVTPLHVPVEGATDDADLTYFRQFEPVLQEILQTGGHAILGCHPDLNLNLPSELLRRLQGETLWFTTVGRAVERVRALMMPGAVRTCRAEGGLSLVSTRTVADVAVEVWVPGAEHPIAATVQLLAERPRPVHPAPSREGVLRDEIEPSRNS